MVCSPAGYSAAGSVALRNLCASQLTHRSAEHADLPADFSASDSLSTVAAELWVGAALGQHQRSTHASTQPAFCMQRRSVVKPFGSEKLALFAAVSRTSFRAQCSAHCSVLPNYRAVLTVQASKCSPQTPSVSH